MYRTPLFPAETAGDKHVQMYILVYSTGNNSLFRKEMKY